MTRNPYTVRPDTPVSDAQSLIRREKIHRLPVLDKHNALVGIVSEKDLLYASPSPASSLSVYEMANLLAKLKVEKVMTKDVITVEEDTLVEDAARVLSDNNIGGLPVMNGKRLTGIVTESDVFKLFIELFGTRRRGIRATLLLPDEVGEIGKVGSAVANAGGNIISVGTFPGEDPTNALCTLKVDAVDKAALIESLEPVVLEIVDIREV
jgi:acetoin utilization protein AcuB